MNIETVTREMQEELMQKIDSEKKFTFRKFMNILKLNGLLHM